MSRELPEFCFVLRERLGGGPGERVALVKRGESGHYWPVTSLPDGTEEEAMESIRKANRKLGVDGIQALCMKNGSLFGFGVPGANPDWVAKHLPHIDAGDPSGEGERHVR